MLKLKITKLINEAKRIDFDQAGFEKAVRLLVQHALDKLPFTINLDGIKIEKIEKTRSPVTFNIHTVILISGNNVVARHKDDQKGNQISINYWFNRLPGNTEITEDILKNLPTYNHTTMEENITQRILSDVSTKDDSTQRINIYRQKFNEVQDEINKIEKEYNVKLELNLYPDEKKFSRDPDEYYSFYVSVRDIAGCLGKFVPPTIGSHYTYTVNGVSYPGFLHHRDDDIISDYGKYETKVSLNEFDITEFSSKIKSELSTHIERIKLLDYLIINDKNIEKEFTDEMQKLNKKYSNIKIGVTRVDTWGDPKPIRIYVTSLSFNEEFTFTMQELSTKERISKAITKIQQKIYKLVKTNNINVPTDVKNFIKENKELLLNNDLDEFYRLAKKQWKFDLRILTYVLTTAGIPIKYNLTDVPDEIKDMI